MDDDVDVSKTFEPVLSFVAHNAVGHASPACRLGANEIYERVKGSGTDLAALLEDETDYKALIARVESTAEKIALALANRRLASGVVPELDPCFAALELEDAAVMP